MTHFVINEAFGSHKEPADIRKASPPLNYLPPHMV